MKKLLCLLLTLAMVLGLAGCGEKPAEETGKDDEDFAIAIVTGTVTQSEDDRRGAEALQKKYGADKVKLATYPDNFGEEYDTTVQTMVNFADDPKVRAIIVNQAVPGTAEAFQKIKELRPDMICLAGEAHEDLPLIGGVADLVVNNDFISRGYLMIHTAHELGCNSFVHISFPRHLAYETMSRRVSVMKEACKDLGMEFVMLEAPDPSDTSSGGMDGAVAFMKENTPKWIEQYGKDTAFFCTNDGETAPMLAAMLANGGYFVEADLPSPLLGYPEALGGLDTTAEAGDWSKIMNKVEQAVIDAGGSGRFGTWQCSLGYSLSYCLGQYAMDVIEGKAELNDEDVFAVFKNETGAVWSGRAYKTSDGSKIDNVKLVIQDTYIFGKGFMDIVNVEIPEKYYSY